MNRLAALHPDLHVQITRLSNHSLAVLCADLIKEIRDIDARSDVDWARSLEIVQQGGAHGWSAEVLALAERIDSRAFDYADDDDDRYVAEFSAARRLTAVAYACAPLDVDACADAVYEFISATGESEKAYVLLARFAD